MDRKKMIGAWLTWGIAGCGLLFARTAYGQSTGVLTGEAFPPLGGNAFCGRSE